jgi:hypothetical protein
MDRPDLSAQPLHEIAITELVWHKADCCASSDCVEVTRQIDVILVRDSKQTTGSVLPCTAQRWQSFVHGIKAGAFDDL